MSLDRLLREALKEQHHATLAMLADCIRKCPDDLWLVGDHPRSFCRIAWHAIFFGHNYLVQTAEDFNRSVSEWPEPIRTALGAGENQKAIDVEPYELPERAPMPSRAEMLEYLGYVDALIDPTVDALDLEREDTGFYWYPNMTKLSHELLGLRHVQGHVGQLSELLMQRGIDTDWVSKGCQIELTA